MASKSEQEYIVDEGCGKHFFHFLPMAVGVCYGVFECGAMLETWWLEGAVVVIVILLMHRVFRSWLYINCRQEIPEVGVTPSIWWTYFFIGTVNAGFIYVFAIVTILFKWLFGLR